MLKVALTGAAGVLLGTFAITASHAETMRSPIAFNTALHEKAPDQPENGVKFQYQVPVEAGDLAGCTINVIEALYGRDEGAWGVFDIEAAVVCADGGFSYTSSGAWDGNGFHAAGNIADGSGSHDFSQASGRVAQLGGTATPADDGTLNVSYELVVETVE